MTWHVVWLWLAQTALGGTLVLGAGCLAAMVCRQPVRRLRLLELTLFGCLLAPWLGLLPGLPRWSVGVLPGAAAEAAPAVPSRHEMTAAAGPYAPGPLADSPPSKETPDPAKADAAPPSAPPSPLADAAPAPSAEPPPAPLLSRVRLPFVLVGAYAALAAGLLAWWCAGFVKLVRLCRSASPAPPEVAAVLREIAGAASARVRLLASDRAALPLAFAGWRPVILLPAGLCRAGDSAALRYCLAHEWSHVERRDVWAWHLASAVQLLFFYQPLFWWLRRQLRLCQDYLADARAAEQAGALDYAEYLVRLARGRTPAPALGIADRRSNLYRRIVMLVQSRQPLETRCRRTWNLAAALAAFVVLALVAAVRLDAGAAPPDDKKDQPKDAAKEPAKGEALSYTGKVTDKDTGKPIEGAVVTVRRSLYGDPRFQGENKVVEETKHTTDPQGKYSFSIPPEQSGERYLYIELDVEHADFAPRKGFGYALGMIRKNEKVGGRPFFEHVELRPGKPVTGALETPEGKPAAGVKVLAYSRTTKPGNNFEYGSFADARTDDSGRFRLVLTTPGEAILWVLPKDHAPFARKLKDDQRGDLGVLGLRDGIAFKGKVLDTKGQPLAGVSVNVERTNVPEDERVNMVADHIGRAALTDEKGEFRMGPLAAGEYRLQPAEHHRDPSDSDRDRKRRPLAAVFVRQKLVLKDGEQPGPVEVRAVPHVVIEAQHYDGKGQKTRGHAFHLFGRVDGDFFFAQGIQDADGKVTAMAPHGLSEVRLSLSTNEHGVLRWRRGKDGPLSNGRDINLGTLNDDVKDVQITRYTAPILLVNAVDKEGKQVKGFQVQVVYTKGKSPKGPNSSFVSGVRGDVNFEKQEDGRWRSSQLLPDEEVEVTARAEGYQDATKTVSLPEGEQKELKFVLEKK